MKAAPMVLMNNSLARLPEAFELAGRTFITSSDAHFIRDIGSRFTAFFMENASLSEIRLALKGQDGRYVAEETC